MTLIIRLFILLLTSAGAYAATIAFYNDYSKNLTAVSSAVYELKSDHTVYQAESIAAFESLLQNEPIDVAILFLQDVPRDARDFPLFSAFVLSGGKVIFADGNRRPSWADLMGFQYSGSTNLTNFAWLDATLTAQTGGTSQTIENPGYITFSMGLEIDERTLGVFDNGDAAVLFLDNHKIINGFLLDTDSLLNAASRASAEIASGANIATILSAQVAYLLDPPLPFPNQPFVPPDAQSSTASSSSAIAASSSSSAAASEAQSSASSASSDDSLIPPAADSDDSQQTPVEVPLNLTALLAVLFALLGITAVRRD